MLSGALAAVSTARVAAAQTGDRGRKAAPEHYELRRIQQRFGPGPKIVSDYLGDALLPALERAGIKTVGVFNTIVGPDMPTTWLLIPYAGPDAPAQVERRLAADATFQKGPSALAYRAATAAQPAYVRIESSWLLAMENLPRLAPPDLAKPRIFELRTYESPTEAASAKKQEMFTKLGETEIFRRVGLQPVFFGRTLIGPHQPSFTYLLTFPDLAAREAAWKAFSSDPEWQKLRATPGYGDADILSNISSVLLRPAPFSRV